MKHTSTETVKDSAKKYFDLVGITSPVLKKEYTNQLKKWLEKEYEGHMTYMARTSEKRINSTLILDTVQSIICVGLNYFPGNHTSRKPDQLKVSRYAWGKDYHTVFEKLLTQFITELQKDFPENQFVYFVDYGPLIEKAYAEQAGLGFMGKNTTLITKEYGSWIFLACILTDLPLEYDTPSKRVCGTCMRCIESCPTGAIKEPGMIDARRCTSYQTIENKSEDIPKDLAKKLFGWVFGCDICQEVCPHNSRAKKTTHPEFLHTIIPGGMLSKKEIETLTEEKFLNKYQHSPLKRAGLKGLQKNIHSMQ